MAAISLKPSIYSASSVFCIGETEKRKRNQESDVEKKFRQALSEKLKEIYDYVVREK